MLDSESPDPFADLGHSDLELRFHPDCDAANCVGRHLVRYACADDLDLRSVQSLETQRHSPLLQACE